MATPNEPVAVATPFALRAVSVTALVPSSGGVKLGLAPVSVTTWPVGPVTVQVKVTAAPKASEPVAANAVAAPSTAPTARSNRETDTVVAATSNDAVRVTRPPSPSVTTSSAA